MKTQNDADVVGVICKDVHLLIHKACNDLSSKGYGKPNQYLYSAFTSGLITILYGVCSGHLLTGP